jgi:hypothetical protein
LPLLADQHGVAKLHLGARLTAHDYPHPQMIQTASSGRWLRRGRR